MIIYLCNKVFESDEFADQSKSISVSGIATESQIKGIEGVSISSIEDGFTKVSLKSKVSNKPLFIEQNPSKIYLISISGGQEYSTTDIVSQWQDFIKRTCLNDNVLIIAAVGNDGQELTKGNGVLPAILQALKSCKGNDNILRVGATNYFEQEKNLNIYRNSNFGAGFVEILAPGAGISILTPKNGAKIGSGTSEATAIVSGTAAQLVSCMPSASAQLIKKAILNNSNHYPHLSKYVLDGTILNIEKVVSSFCTIGKMQDSHFLTHERRVSTTATVQIADKSLVQIYEYLETKKDLLLTILFTAILVLVPAFLVRGRFHREN